MAITLEPIRLDAPFGDNEGMLAKRDECLIAVLSRLGELHGDLIGHWFVEAIFTSGVVKVGHVFPDLQAFEARAEAGLNSL